MTDSGSSARSVDNRQALLALSKYLSWVGWFAVVLMFAVPAKSAADFYSLQANWDYPYTLGPFHFFFGAPFAWLDILLRASSMCFIYGFVWFFARFFATALRNRAAASAARARIE